MDSPPKSCVIFDVGFVDFEKMTFLEFFDMYLMIFDINSKYLVRFSQYLIKFININQICWYKTLLCWLKIEKCKQFSPAAGFGTLLLRYFVIYSLCLHVVVIQSLFSRYPVVVRSLSSCYSVVVQSLLNHYV